MCYSLIECACARALVRAPSLSISERDNLRERERDIGSTIPIDPRTVSGIYLQPSVCLNYAVNNTSIILNTVKKFRTISWFHSEVVESVGNPVGCTYTIKISATPSLHQSWGAWCIKWNWLVVSHHSSFMPGISREFCNQDGRKQDARQPRWWEAEVPKYSLDRFEDSIRNICK